jgi:hypothetical protein
LAEAERDPKGLMDNSPIVEDGIRWVPFDEQKHEETGDAVPASHNTALHPDHRALHRYSRQAMSREMDRAQLE